MTFEKPVSTKYCECFNGDVNVFRIKNILLCVYLFDFLKSEYFGNSRWANKYTQTLKTFLVLCVHSIFFSLRLKKEFIVETGSKCLVKVKWRQQVQESVILCYTLFLLFCRHFCLWDFVALYIRSAFFYRFYTWITMFVQQQFCVFCQYLQKKSHF